MLSAQEITKRRIEAGKKRSILQLLQTKDGNNNAKKIHGKSHDPVKCNDKKCKLNCFGDKERSETSKWKKIRLPLPPSKEKKKTTPAEASVPEYFEDEVGGEPVIINKIRSHTADNDQDFSIVIRDYLTPENYTKSVDYYRAINVARETYLRASVNVGDVLSRHRTRGDWEDWEKYIRQADEDKRKWRQVCQLDDQRRDREIRNAEWDSESSWQRIVRKGSTWLRKCRDEFKDIFPCCFDD